MCVSFVTSLDRTSVRLSDRTSVRRTGVPQTGVRPKQMFAERMFVPNKCSPVRQRDPKCLTVSPVDKPVDNIVADYK